MKDLNKLFEVLSILHNWPNYILFRAAPFRVQYLDLGTNRHQNQYTQSIRH